MKVILSESVPNLGEMGQTVNVADGYARNFLLPRKLAVRADSGSAKQIQHELRMIKSREEKKRAKLQEYARKLEKLTVDIKARAGEEDKLFGSVTSAAIAEHLKELGHELDRRSIALAEPIRTLGIYSVPAKLGLGVTAELKVWVRKEEEPPAEPSAEQASEAAAEAGEPS